MAPLIALGISLIPSLARLLIGERAGTVAESVAQVVKDVTGTDDPVAAKARLDADPAIASTLRIRLAEIALEGERLHAEAAQQRRQAELDSLREEMKNTQGARDTMTTLAAGGSWLAWGPVIISGIVTVGFFGILIFFTAWPPEEGNRQAYSLLNIAVGALVAGFTAVVNFWIGSSQSSRQKDETVRELTSQQNRLAGETVVRAQTALASSAAGTGSAIATAVESVVRSVTGVGAGVSLPAIRPSAFDRCVEIVLSKEGGFSDHPRDPGGATKFGITRATLEGFRGKPVTREDVQALTQEEAREIYRTNYWNAIKADQLPPGMDLIVFDFGVNAGCGRAVKMLQGLVGAEQDGGVGERTLAAVKTVPPEQLIARYAESRIAYYRSLDTFDTFGAGWLNRVEFVRNAALRLTKG